ncbi:unnamed protein product [Effrenium voratum]|uniref:Dual specificity protein phosphatase n=2 Tax=Effrenium voratum TaxID=2562239 RepID=A0AA36I590_9DINO|nr:unnamed protein product [Effrenium voratum]
MAASAARGRDGNRRADAAEADMLLEWLFLGSKAAAEETFLQRHGIGCVLSCCRAPLLPCPTKQLPMQDSPEEQLAPFLEDALGFLSEAKARGEKCLVHCSAGSSRSVAIVLAYLILSEKLPLCDALALLRARRPRARPNVGFARQLIDLDRATHGHTSVTLADMGFDDQFH